MRRLFLVISGVSVLAFAAAAIAGTKPTTLAGAAEWSAQTTTIHGSFTGKLAGGTYAGTLQGGDPCTNSGGGPVCEPVTGTITFASGRGDFTGAGQPGSVVAVEEIASHSFRRFTITLAVVGGTRDYARARGTLTLAYVSTREHQLVDGAYVDAITDTGTLSGEPRR